MQRGPPDCLCCYARCSLSRLYKKEREDFPYVSAGTFGEPAIDGPALRPVEATGAAGEDLGDVKKQLQRVRRGNPFQHHNQENDVTFASW